MPWQLKLLDVHCVTSSSLCSTWTARSAQLGQSCPHRAALSTTSPLNPTCHLHHLPITALPLPPPFLSSPPPSHPLPNPLPFPPPFHHCRAPPPALSTIFPTSSPPALSTTFPSHPPCLPSPLPPPLPRQSVQVGHICSTISRHRC